MGAHSMHVTFLNPPFLRRFSRESRSPSVTKSNTLYYPHWLCYGAAATSVVPGVEIDVIDAAPEDLDMETVVLPRLVAHHTQMAVLDTSTPSIYSDLRVADAIKRRLPDCVVVLVGPHVTATLPETFAYAKEHGLQFDYVFHGEYDLTCQQAAAAICAGQSDQIRSFRGVTSTTPDGNLVENPRNDPITDLDQIPFVSRIYAKFLDIPKYFMSHTKYPQVTLISGRGCPYHCTFCQLPQVMYGHTYRKRSAKNFVDEIEYLHNEVPFVKGVMLEDDTFTADQERVRAICSDMIGRGLTRLELTCNARANVTKETMDIMHQAGFRMMCVGFESGDQATLNKMRKGTKWAIIEQFIEDAGHSKIKVHGCFMYGNRDETYDTMQKTLDFALRAPIDTAQFYPIMVSPGTADYQYYKDNGMLNTEDFSAWNDAEGQHRSTIKRKNLTEKDIEDFCDYSRRQFYMRPKYWWMKGKESLRDFDHLKKNLRGFMVLAKHLVRRPGRSASAY
jgi:radical SAM superfamily enzyme YgiQ (UPF0313 family)